MAYSMYIRPEVTSVAVNHDVCHYDCSMAHSTRNNVHVGPQGRVVIPAHIRKALDIRPGERLVARVEDDQIVFERPDHVLERLRARFDGLPEGTSLSRELIADRREEARRESQS